jgi:hypothetical protein
MTAMRSSSVCRRGQEKKSGEQYKIEKLESMMRHEVIAGVQKKMRKRSQHISGV